MSLITYNFLWGIIKYFLPKYLERRQKKGKEDSKRINERFGFREKKDLKELLFGSMEQVSGSQLQL